MKKPITILRSEFIENITSTINNSGLPFFAIRQVLTELLEVVRQGEEAQEQKDRAEYKRYIIEVAKNNSENSSDDQKCEKKSEIEG